MTARITRSVVDTTWFQSRTMAASVAAKGSTTAVRFTRFSSFVMDSRLGGSDIAV